jgi:hypothetical protein
MREAKSVTPNQLLTIYINMKKIFRGAGCRVLDELLKEPPVVQCQMRSVLTLVSNRAMRASSLLIRLKSVILFPSS